MSTSEIYISTDVETDGPIPGPHSMLSFASVAFDDHGIELGHFARNLEPLPEASGHPTTMAWWAETQEAWALCRMNLAAKRRSLPNRKSSSTTFCGRMIFAPQLSMPELSSHDR